MRSYKVDIEVFERMPAARAVLVQSIPAIVAQLIALLYNWADTFFLARLNKPELVAAATIVLPLYLMLTAIGNLPGVGGGSQFANHLGKHDYTGAQRVASVTFWMGMILALVSCMLFPLCSDTLLSLIGANERTIAPAQEYAFWVITVGGIPVIMNLVLANLVRAEGMALQASIGISAGGILNCLLDPLLILPDMGNMGIAGAGIATAVSNMVSVLWLLVVVYRRRKTGVLTFAPQLLRYTRQYIVRIAKVGFPSSVQYMLTVLAVAALTHFVAQYNTEATAALGIVKRLDYLPLYFTIGLSQGFLPLLAYNHSSGNVDRRNQVFRCGCIISFGFAVLCFVVYEIWAYQLAMLFTQESLTVSYIVPFLRIQVVAMPFMAVCYPSITLFQAMERSREALVCSILRKGVIDIPLLIVMNALWPLFGCMWVQPIVDITSMLVAFYFLYSLHLRLFHS
jgi:putative MATE family efflux protein